MKPTAILIFLMLLFPGSLFSQIMHQLETDNTLFEFSNHGLVQGHDIELNILFDPVPSDVDLSFSYSALIGSSGLNDPRRYPRLPSEPKKWYQSKWFWISAAAVTATAIYFLVDFDNTSLDRPELPEPPMPPGN